MRVSWRLIWKPVPGAMTDRPLIRRLSDLIWDEQEDARRRAVIEGEVVEPTPSEARNGWTAKTLTEYLRERHAAQTLWVDPTSYTRRVKPQRQNMAYSPFRWRG